MQIIQIARFVFSGVLRGLEEAPAVCLLGPRQVGKTTLALAVAEQRRSIYLDLESEQDRAKLHDPEAYLAEHLDKLVILDELHRMPGLFPILWVMLAHRQGAPLNLSEFARSLGMDVRTVHRYLDLLVDLMLVRRLPPWQATVAKRLMKSPRLYIRDSGLVHALLGIRDREELLAHPIAGASWEGFVIENLAASAPEGTELYFYRTSGGAEIDLLLILPAGELWAVEIKRSLAPRPDRGFSVACQDVHPTRRWVIYPGEERFPLDNATEAISLKDLASWAAKSWGSAAG